MNKASWIRTVYLYLMTTVGIVVFIIGAITLLNLLLKIFIFTQADADYWSGSAPSPIFLSSEIKQAENLKECSQLTENDRMQIKNWLIDYQRWQEQEKNLDRRQAQRERDAARALAMVLVGLPVWLFHWNVIKRDKRREEEYN